MENQNEDQKGIKPDWSQMVKSPTPPPPPPPEPFNPTHESEKTGLEKAPHTGNAISGTMLGGIGIKR